MCELLHYGFFQRALAGAVLGGAACGIVGVWIVMLNIPFVGVAMAHAAFAGAVFGLLCGIDPLFAALIFCIAAAFLIGPVADRGGFSPGISVGVIFSLVLGLAFLGIGMLSTGRSEALNFLWGNILTVSAPAVWLLAVFCAGVIAFLALFYKEVLAVLFNREMAAAAGIPEKMIFYAVLVMCGVTVTLNLNSIGGLLVFSLITAAPLAAAQLTFSLKARYLLSAVFGSGSCVAGLLIAGACNVPPGAVIVMVANALLGVCMAVAPKRRKTNEGSSGVLS